MVRILCILFIFLISCKKDQYIFNLYLKNKTNNNLLIYLIENPDTLKINLNSNEKKIIYGGFNYFKIQPNNAFYQKCSKILIFVDSNKIELNSESDFTINPFINRSLWIFQNFNTQPHGFKGKLFELNYEFSIDSLYFNSKLSKHSH